MGGIEPILLRFNPVYRSSNNTVVFQILKPTLINIWQLGAFITIKVDEVECVSKQLYLHT